MRPLKILRKTPVWFILVVVFISAAIVFTGIINPYGKLVNGVPIDTSYYPNPYIWEKVPPIMPYVPLWSSVDIGGGFICLLLGFVCLLLGFARSFNKLDGKQDYMMAVFSILFSLETLTVTDLAAQIFPPAVLFYAYWISFFGYPIVIFLHFFFSLRSSLHKWTWPLVFLPAVFSAVAWTAYFTLGLPFDMPDKLYTPLTAVCFILLMFVGIFGTEQKGSVWFMRILLIFWIGWSGYLAVKAQLGYQFFIHDEFKNGMILSTVIIVCYLVFTSTKELFTYKSGMQILEVKNGLLMENYQHLETCMTQLAQMKHEMHHHFLAIKMLHEGGKYEQLAGYLANIQNSYPEPVAPIPCGNHMIQSILGHAAQRAKQMDFEISFDITPLPPLSITDADVVSLLMNLINNALESCEKIQDNRWITVAVKSRTPYLYVSVQNALFGSLKLVNGRYASTKVEAAFHGHGLSVVRSIADKYNGFVEFENTDNSFCVEVALRIVSEEIKTEKVLQ